MHPAWSADKWNGLELDYYLAQVRRLLVERAALDRAARAVCEPWTEAASLRVDRALADLGGFATSGDAR
jgi:hypothetical protein